jgi:hypothetical protein
MRNRVFPPQFFNNLGGLARRVITYSGTIQANAEASMERSGGGLEKLVASI